MKEPTNLQRQVWRNYKNATKKFKSQYTKDNPRPHMPNASCAHCHKFPWHHDSQNRCTPTTKYRGKKFKQKPVTNRLHLPSTLDE